MQATGMPVCVFQLSFITVIIQRSNIVLVNGGHVFWYSAIVAGQWLPSLRHITDICLQLVSLLFRIPRICCSSAVVTFSLSCVSQSSCLLERLAITHHVGEHAQAICVFVDLSCWWYSDSPWLDSELQSCWLLLTSGYAYTCFYLYATLQWSMWLAYWFLNCWKSLKIAFIN